MIKIFTIFLILFITTYICPQWTKVEPFHISYNLNSVSFTDENTGYAASQFGILIKTTNGGINWKTLGTVAEGKLNSIFMIKDAYGFAVGENGTIISSLSDSSREFDLWIKQQSGIKNNLNSVYFTNPLLGYTSGDQGIILKTTNAGFVWSKQVSGSTTNQYSIFFIDEKNGWSAGGKNNYGTIIHTSNGGKNWVSQFNKNISGNLFSVFFINNNLGWAVGGNGTILKTTNGGSTWQSKNSGTTFILKSVKFFNQKNGIAAGDGGIVLRTSDGGESWKLKTSSTNKNLQSVSISNSGNSWIVGISGNIIKSNNFGDNWSNQEWVTDFTFKDVFFIDNKTGWITGGPGFIFKTTDAGITWDQQESNTGFWLNSVFFIDENNGWIAGKSGLENDYDATAGPNFNICLKTTDGGKSWKLNKLNPIADRFNVYGAFSVQFIDKNTGWISGYAAESSFPEVFPEGIIYKTTDGGNTWDFTFIDNTNSIKKIHFLDDNIGWCVDGFEYGSGGVLLSTVDGGNQWESINSDLQVSSDFFFLNRQTGWLAGIDFDFAKVILITGDKGQSWQKEALPFLNVASSIYFVDEQTGWIAGKEENQSTGALTDLILNTTDGGINWVKQSIGEFSPLRKIFFVDKQHGWTVGENGNILKYNSPLSSTCVDVSFKKGWNIISVPLKVEDNSVKTVFPSSDSKAVNITGEHVVQTDNLENGKAYWIDFVSSGKEQICGSEINTPVPVKKGWNLISPFNKELKINEVASSPVGIITSGFYEFNNGFNKVSTLKAGKGYFVKVSADGYLNYGVKTLTSDRTLAKTNDNWNRLKIEDKSGTSTNLYDISGTEVNLYEYELPPVPPTGIFDARYENGLMAADLGKESKKFYITSAEYPIKIKAEGCSFKLKYMLNGNPVETIIEDGKEFTIEDNSIKVVEASRTSAINGPVKYALFQNYPNPFNPATKIKYEIAEHGRVKIFVYSVLGEKIAELVNQEMEPGLHEVSFNGSNLSSGMYIYKIEMDKFNDVKKMLLLK